MYSDVHEISIIWLVMIGDFHSGETSRLFPGAPAPNKLNGYLLGTNRIATAPEPNSSWLTSLKSTCFDSPANNVGPWPASLGCALGRDDWRRDKEPG
jgi:hypothetical protein